MKPISIAAVTLVLLVSAKAQTLEPIGIETEGTMVATSTLVGTLLGVGFESGEAIERYRTKSPRAFVKKIESRECFYVGTSLDHHLFVIGPITEDGKLKKVLKRWKMESSKYTLSDPNPLTLPRDKPMMITLPELQTVQSIDETNKIIKCQQDASHNAGKPAS